MQPPSPRFSAQLPYHQAFSSYSCDAAASSEGGVPPKSETPLPVHADSLCVFYLLAVQVLVPVDESSHCVTINGVARAIGFIGPAGANLPVGKPSNFSIELVVGRNICKRGLGGR